MNDFNIFKFAETVPAYCQSCGKAGKCIKVFARGENNRFEDVLGHFCDACLTFLAYEIEHRKESNL